MEGLRLIGAIVALMDHTEGRGLAFLGLAFSGASDLDVLARWLSHTRLLIHLPVNLVLLDAAPSWHLGSCAPGSLDWVLEAP